MKKLWQTVKRKKIFPKFDWEKPLCKKSKKNKMEGRKKMEGKDMPSKRKIVLKMVSTLVEPTAGFAIPIEMVKLLGIWDEKVYKAKQLFVVLYNDGTISLERVPEKLFVEIPKEVEIKPPLPPTPIVPKVPREKKKPKKGEKEIPPDWIKLTETYYLTPEGEIRRSKTLRIYLNKEKVIVQAKIIKSSKNRKEAIDRLKTELKLTDSSAKTYYPMVKKTLPHLEKQLAEKPAIPEKALPAPPIEAPKELVNILKEKEEEEI